MASSFAEAKRLSPFIPTPDAYARAAVRWIGHGPLCAPNLGHQLLWCLAAVVPDFVHDELLLREHLWQRKVFQRMGSSRASSRDGMAASDSRDKLTSKLLTSQSNTIPACRCVVW